jgi:anti-sigma regulatory factor (Ser/Thr protein kinase)
MEEMDANESIRAGCLVKSPKLRRTVEWSLRAAGYTLENCESLDDAEAVRLLFVDQETRKTVAPDALSDIVAKGGSVVMLGDSIADDEVANLLQTEHLDHVISDENGLDEVELLITTVKLASGDIFGIEKYLPWGARVYEYEIGTYDDKGKALQAVVGHAKNMGARRALMARIEHATDELLMNAIYDAPALAKGVSTQSQMGMPIGEDKKAVLRYGCDGRYFAVSATDLYGKLSKQAIFTHLLRARKDRTPKQDDGRAGAGLGLFIILSSVTRFVANIASGERTEVICLFDLKQTGRQMETCARSVHIFNPNAKAA